MPQHHLRRMMELWEVVGGVDRGGVLVRSGQALSSQQFSARLSTGACIEEVELVGDRLHYKRRSGTGPEEGWISIAISGKLLAQRAAEAFHGTWSVEEADDTELFIDGDTMEGLGTTAAFSII